MGAVIAISSDKTVGIWITIEISDAFNRTNIRE